MRGAQPAIAGEDEPVALISAMEKEALLGTRGAVLVDNATFIQQLRKRAGVLVGLLVFQSCSSFILSSYERLLQKHSVVVFFLTMLVGAGGVRTQRLTRMTV